jgi:hypothetical protein
MTLTLIADKITKGKIYPAFARHQGRPYTQSWREFGQHWPYTVPLRLQEYCDHHTVKLNIVDLASAWPADAMYPIGLGFFDFDIDYFELLPDRVKAELFWNNVRVLFYYHEGDNPFHIKQRLDELCAKHNLRNDCYVFISANTAAQGIPGFVYFNDFELWYWQRNEHTPAYKIHNEPRDRDFTVLNRLHKTWRATAMADMCRQGILDNSYWSYCETGSIVDEDNPIQIDAFDNLRSDTQKFLESGPYFSDTLTQDERNNHSIQEPRYYKDAYCNIIMETHFDADGCYGTFLTEKTFKPIKHGQLFFIAGPAGSLQLLRDQGYKTFDDILDNRYDDNVSSTQRWELLCQAIAKAKPKLPELFERAREDIEHNQRLFVAKKTERLNILLEQLNESY